MQKKSEHFFMISFTQKKLKPKSFDANYFSFYSRRPFPAGNNKKIWVDVVNKYQRCRTKMHSCHARHCSTPGLKESPWRRDSCWSAFSLSAERFHVWDFGREKKTKALNMVYFYWWHRWDLFHFLLDSQLLGIFNGFFFKF